MANRKKSAAQKKLTGTFRPDRDSKNAPVSPETLGPPPNHLTDAEKEIWIEISSKLPERTATAADSLSFEILVKLMGRSRTGELSGVETTLLMRSFANFGMTPMHRGSIEPAPGPPKPSRWGKFKTN